MHLVCYKPFTNWVKPSKVNISAWLEMGEGLLPNGSNPAKVGRVAKSQKVAKSHDGG